jgi:hypothetical protein
MKKISILPLIICCLIQLTTGCKKLLNVPTPQNQLTTDKVFTDTASVQSAIVSIYASLNVDADPNYNINLSLYTDELTYGGSTQDYIDFDLSKVAVTNTANLNTWKTFYLIIYQCNNMITQLAKSKLPAQANLQYNSEAKFLRAYAYYYLINLYGHIPLILTTDVNANLHASQSDSSLVNHQIISDLTDAENGLGENYIGSGRVRANKWSAAALLAKVYLYQRDWKNADLQSSSVINSGLYTPLASPLTVFEANSNETILSIATLNGYITDGPNLIAGGGVPQFPINDLLFKSFETGDLRKSAWIDTITQNGTLYYYPFKYHNNSDNLSTPENLVILRAGDQYLVRAEAEIQENNIASAVADINTIRTRADLPLLKTGIDQNTCMNALIAERWHELFTENGNRFFDLKRTGRINSVLNSAKSGWSPSASLLPIPRNEITYDNNLVQNPGY